MTEGGSERHERTGSKTTVVLGASDRERPGWLARMRTAQVQVAARVQIPLLCDSGETPAPVAPRPRDGPRGPAAHRPGLRRRAQGERPALGPRREDGGGRRPPEARDGRDRQRATSWRTSRPSSTKWPTVASVATPTSRPRRATRRCPASSCPFAKTRRYPATVSDRLGFVSAPRYGSWPDLVEGIFSKIIRQMPCGIRASSKDEPEERILRHHRERMSSRSSVGGGGACRTWARRPRGSSWTPSFRMGQTRHVSCWTLYEA